MGMDAIGLIMVVMNKMCSSNNLSTHSWHHSIGGHQRVGACVSKELSTEFLFRKSGATCFGLTLLVDFWCDRRKK
jgi:hypothetical protein